MSGRSAATARVWVVLAVCGAVGGCASSGERLPKCRGQAVPINAVATAGALEQAAVRDMASAEADDAHDGASHVE